MLEKADDLIQWLGKPLWKFFLDTDKIALRDKALELVFAAERINPEGGKYEWAKHELIEWAKAEGMSLPLKLLKQALKLAIVKHEADSDTDEEEDDDEDLEA